MLEDPLGLIFFVIAEVSPTEDVEIKSTNTAISINAPRSHPAN